MLLAIEALVEFPANACVGMLLKWASVGSHLRCFLADVDRRGL